MRTARRLGLLPLALLAGTSALAGCGDDGDSTSTGTGGAGGGAFTVPAGCNPLAADADCLLPYPSDVFLATEGGDRRVVVPEAAQLRLDERAVDPLAFHRPDGFPVGTPILALLPGPLDDTPLVFWRDDLERSKGDDSPTILIDTTTGERVAHFAELDPRAADVPERQGLVIHPMDRLEPDRRYVVAIRGLVRADGAAVDAPEGFRRLRDQAAAGVPELEAIAARYESGVFAPLAEAGVARDGLLLAWDFTTRTDADAMSDLLAIRGDLMERFEAAPPAIEVASVESDVSAHVATRVTVNVKVPLYVDSAEPGALLNASGGQAAPMGEASVPVTIHVPKSVAARTPGTPPATLVQYGHGFFGTRAECEDYPAALADELGLVLVCTDWWGMSEPDRGQVAAKLAADPANTMHFTDRLHQGFANHVAAAYAALGPIAALPELQIGGVPAYDANRVVFYGVSLGHILGSTYVAISPHVERAILEVGGTNLSMMMFRAQPFGAFLALLQAGTSDPLDHQKFAALAQSAFDRVDNLSYARELLASTLPGAPATRRVLMRMGLGDASVPNLGTLYQARVLGIPLLEGTAASVPLGLATTPDPAPGSALAVYDFGVEPNDLATVPASNEVHEGLRQLPTARQQIGVFIGKDELTSFCDGTCNPE
jgi:hypothetical protein